MGMERMSVIEKGNSIIMLMDQTRIVVPKVMIQKLMEREHLSHQGQSKMDASIRAKYFWPGIESDVKKLVETCEPCQLHMRGQTGEPIRPALKYVSRPMQAIGIDFFQKKGTKYLILVDHFSGLPMYHNMG